MSTVIRNRAIPDRQPNPIFARRRRRKDSRLGLGAILSPSPSFLSASGQKVIRFGKNISKIYVQYDVLQRSYFVVRGVSHEMNEVEVCGTLHKSINMNFCFCYSPPKHPSPVFNERSAASCCIFPPS